MENQRLETAKMLMSFYNMIAGTRFRIGDNNRKVDEIMDAVDRANGSMRDIKAHIRTWVKENPESAKNSAMDCFREYSPIIQAPAVEQASQPTDVTPQAANNALGLLEQAVVKMISETSAEKIESEIMGTVEDKVRQFIKDEYGTIERKVTTIIDGKPKDMQGVTHEKFETILKFVANNEPVFLAGPAGSGKNVICKQVAEALGLKFYFTNAVTQEYKLTGFTDANGNYQPTQFFKAFTEGGVFMLDEMDASIPEVLIILNAAIANGYFDFPAPIGYREAHPDFRVIAAGNTFGYGADSNYVGRNQLDGASLDRFALVIVDYSESIENAVTNGDTELVAFGRDLRKSAERAGVQLIISYRALGRIAKMINLMSVEEVLDTCLIKGMEKDDMNHIYDGLRLKDNKYATGLKKLIGMAA